MNATRTIGREIGTAFAVLAIYLLTILAPMHHARASQLAFEQLGYTALDTNWALCGPLSIDGSDGDVLVAKCPATSAGKSALVEPLPIAIAVRHVVALIAPLPALLLVPTLRPTAAPGAPRGPPIPV